MQASHDARTGEPKSSQTTTDTSSGASRGSRLPRSITTKGFDEALQLLTPRGGPGGSMPMSGAAHVGVVARAASDAYGKDVRAPAAYASPSTPVQLKEKSEDEEEPEVLQDPEWFEKQKKAGRFEDITKDEFFAEYLAKCLVYKPVKEYSDYDLAMLRAWGYEVPHADDVVMNEQGLYVARFDPTEENLKKDPGASSQIAFRGTEFTNLDVRDFASDLYEEVGKDQYEAGDTEDEIRALVGGAQGEHVRLTGHSLGGALAQRAASDLGDETNITALTTFQSAGVDEDVMERMDDLDKDIDVDHFQVVQDMVSKCGDGHVAGTFHTIDADVGEGEAHNGYFNYNGREGNPEEGPYLPDGPHELTISDEDPNSPLTHDVVEILRHKLAIEIGYLSEQGAVAQETYNRIETALDESESNTEMVEEIGDALVDGYVQALENYTRQPLEELKHEIAIAEEMLDAGGHVLEEVGELFAEDAAAEEEHTDLVFSPSAATLKRVADQKFVFRRSISDHWMGAIGESLPNAYADYMAAVDADELVAVDWVWRNEVEMTSFATYDFARDNIPVDEDGQRVMGELTPDEWRAYGESVVDEEVGEALEMLESYRIGRLEQLARATECGR